MDLPITFATFFPDRLLIQRWLSLLAGVSLFTAACAGDEVVEVSAFTPEQIEFFEAKIRPVLTEHCYDCHSTDAPEVEAGLYVDSREGLLRGGESGVAIVVGKPDESLLIQAVNYEAGEMPPDRKLPKKHIDALSVWVEMGAPWPEVTSSPGAKTASLGIDWSTYDWDAARKSHWAWQPVKRPDVPTVADRAGDHPIDSFIAAKQTAAGIGGNPPADSATLARRIYVDLIGIPPTPQQVQAFIDSVEQNRQQAVGELVDRLLASPMYGQRWSRHWLDVARYSDGHGGFLDNRALDEAWRYRDWVVDALNKDMPINEFIQLQIAGDLTGAHSDAIATGFFALGPTYRSDGGDPESVAQAKGETLDDRIDTLTRGLLGITGSCARCHDHKFDPIPQLDYYALAGIFNNTAVHARPLVDAATVNVFEDHKRQVDELNKQVAQLNKLLKNEKRDATESEQKQLNVWKQKLENLAKNAPPKYAVTHSLREAGSGDMKVALRGNLLKTGDVAPRRFPRILAEPGAGAFHQGSGRAELAEQIVDPKNPLTARVFVNRIWMHHFGVGLVNTPSNFGTLGEPPSHPRLLDWLADEFVTSGWSLKSLHHLIMNSAAYQRSSKFNETAFQIDGDNRLLWRMTPRRMDVEAWRDSLLAVTGELDASLGGASLPDVITSRRRTLYAKVSRNGDVFPSDQFLRRFDFPLMRATVSKRPNSVVPQQFLFLLNSRFMVDRAKSLVGKLQLHSESNEQRIEQAYQILYHRSPDMRELQIGMEYVAGEATDDHLSTWDRYAQVLLSSNEFMYVR